MFSCCRANSKNEKTTKKDKNQKSKIENENNSNSNNGGDNNKQRVIPTITIENGLKTDDDDNENNDVGDVKTITKDGDDDDSEAKCSTCSDAPLENNRTTATTTAETELETKTTTNETTTITVAAADITTENSFETNTTETIVKNYQNDDHNSKSSPATSLTDDSTNTTLNQINSTSIEETTSSAATATTHRQPANNNNVDDNNIYRPPLHHQPSSSDVTPAKSCISRHNSMHHSIKKKVNISTHAEIIEPDPLPPPPYDHASLGDDDDVFSDSLPPQKRESMCAPYIEGDDTMPDTIAFAHGLPEWFNDERINDIGCTEPPVTPVGRDELELKRQRLYTELLRAAQAAVEHSVRFTPFGGGANDTTAFATQHYQHFDTRTEGGGSGGEKGGGGDCDPDLKPSVAENLDHLVDRLERLVERLERSVSARELEIANRAFDTVKRESFDIETRELPPLPLAEAESPLSQQLTQHADKLNQRIERIESTLNKINDRQSNSASVSSSQNSQQQQLKEGSLENIPTVLEDYQSQNEEVDEEEEEPLLLPPPPSMSVLGYQDIVSGPLSQYLSLSAKIGGDVAKQAQFVKLAFDAQLQYITLATQCAQPSQDKLTDLLKPTSTQISNIQDYREKNRTSPFFNHLSAISESIPALGWVCVARTPGPHVKEMNDAGQFYTNRVLKEWKEKDAKHVEWARSWLQTLTELQAYIKQYHTTGLVWSGKGSAPAAAAGGAPPPPPPIGSCPPPPAFDLAAMSLEGSGDERSALFAEINQGEAITKSLKKVTSDMQTHKNPTLRSGPAPFKTPEYGSVGASGGVAVKKEPVFMRDGKKWLIEYQKNNPGLLVENAEMNNVVYVFKCEGSTLTVKGKVNNIVFDSCKKCSLLFDSVVASIEFVNCQSVQMQTLGFVPTISIDKTDGCQMFLTKESLGVEIVSSKSSEMNVVLPQANGDYTELAVPEQFKTTISGKTLKTVCVDSLG